MTPPLTVMQLLPALDSGGVEHATLETAQALQVAGHQAVVVSAGGALLPALRECGAEHVTLDIGRKSPATLRHVRNLRRLVLRRRPDVLHARSRLPAWIAWLTLRGLSPELRPGFVTTVHGLNSPSRYSAVMTRGDRVICVSQTVRTYVLQHYPQTDPARLRVIMEGIDTMRFQPMPDQRGFSRRALAERHPELGGRGPLLLLPGRGTRLKGHADALALLAALREAGHPDARLWMPGVVQQGRERYLDHLRMQARRLDIGDAVLFDQATAEMPAAYAASDLVLQLSRKPEAFGRTVGEALAMGRPVLGWDHGGVGELLAQWQPQGAVPPFDHGALLACAGRLLHAPPTQAVDIPYTLQATQHATLELYAEIARRQ